MSLTGATNEVAYLFVTLYIDTQNVARAHVLLFSSDDFMGT